MASNLYVNTENEMSHPKENLTSPPDILKDHLINKLGFQEEPLPSAYEQR